MKKIKLLAVVTTLMLALTGCGNYAKKYDNNTIIVEKKGSLVEVAVEDFTGVSVNEEDLTSYIEGEVTAYNESVGEKLIKQDSFDTEDMSHVKLVLTYKDIVAYNDFNNLEWVLDDISEVETASLTGTFQAVDGSNAKIADIKEESKAKVLILFGATDVVIKGDILYYNEEVTYDSETEVATTTGNANAVIIYK